MTFKAGKVYDLLTRPGRIRMMLRGKGQVKIAEAGNAWADQIHRMREEASLLPLDLEVVVQTSEGEFPKSFAIYAHDSTHNFLRMLSLSEEPMRCSYCYDYEAIAMLRARKDLFSEFKDYDLVIDRSHGKALLIPPVGPPQSSAEP